MISELLRRSWLVGALALGMAGCVGGPEEDGAVDSASDDVTDISQTAIRRQSIGNCWIYATVGWAEALHKRQTGMDTNLSESYLTWWHWYDQITNGEATDHVETGGHWGVAGDIITRHGLVMEGDFIPSEANSELSEAQRRALTAVDEALRTGELRERTARTPARVRALLDRAFGTDMAAAERRAVRANAYAAGRSGTRTLYLSDMLGTARSTWNPDQRSGTYAWRGVAYPYRASDRTTFLRRVLRAMNDGHPVIISWLVDFNALDNEGDFELQQLQSAGMVGRQGGHLSVLHDYVVDNVPGVPGGTLGLGVLSPAQRTQALQGTLRFFRIKNSWGARRPDRSSHDGYYDLYMTYLNGPIAWKLSEDANAPTTPRTPISSFILPPGY
jgi:hypothetical protein